LRPLLMEEVSCQALLFDMDGVLIDSTPAAERVWRQWAREHGLDPNHVAHIFHGRPSINTIRELLPDGDQEAENRVVEQREMEDTEGVVTFPGARELLAVLPMQRWAIVTSCTRALADVRLRATGLPTPRHLVTASDVQRGKPHPEPYLKAAQMLSVTPQQAVVVEDAPAGIRAGKSAGCRVIALRTTMPEDELRRAGPDWIVANCAAIRLLEANAVGLRLVLVA